ncbi:conserved Plasmodium protein, unknown function [Plasmodium ovale]|uniref:Gamma tubulin complex component protein N-terminal domain-containing protein n=1 Tax=Plasmodium ovale TaxID=36330 RepID=A0A1C3KRV9_PLAOA|nr:conserved Plasmodium protein, unknown function [Plasmodium ovale]
MQSVHGQNKSERRSTRGKVNILDQSNLSLLRIIDEWCTIEANSYPIQDKKIVKKIKSEIKRFIYANILHKTKVNFNLFKTFYNYKYNYDLKYVNSQFLFEIYSTSSKPFYHVLKNYHQERGKNYYTYFSEMDENNLNSSENIERENNIFGNTRRYMENFFHIKQRLSNNGLIEEEGIGRDIGEGLLLTQVYTAMTCCCLILIKNKYYLDFLCLYLYFKSFFSINKLILWENTILHFTTHEKVLSLFFLLTNITMYINNEKKLGRQVDTYTEGKSFFNFDKLNEDINIGNVTELSFNLLLNLRVKINFNDTNYDLNVRKYQNICNFILLFHNKLTDTCVLKLNELTGLTNKCKLYIMEKKKKKNDTNMRINRNSPFANDPFANNPFANDPFANDPFAHAPFAHAPFANDPFANDPFANAPFELSLGKTSPHISSRHNTDNEQQKGIHFSLPIDMKQCVHNNNLSLFINPCKNIFLPNENARMSIDGNKTYFLRQNDDHTTLLYSTNLQGGKDDILKNHTLKGIIGKDSHTDRKIRLSFCHSRDILSFSPEDIYNEDEEVYNYLFTNSSCYRKNENKIKVRNNDVGSFFNRTDDMYICKEDSTYANDKFFLWNKSYSGDTSVLKIMEKKIVIERKEKYKNYFLSIINSIYVTVHKNSIYSINNRIEEYRVLILKRFFPFFCKKGYDDFDLTPEWQQKVLSCLLGYANEIFPCHSDRKKTSTTVRGKTKVAHDVHEEGNTRSHVFTSLGEANVCSEELEMLERGAIYISRNIICVDDNIAFWNKKKGRRAIRLCFEPFRSCFSSIFYQKYFHIFVYFSKVGTLVRYIKMFVHVFTKIFFQSGGGGDGGGVHSRIRDGCESGVRDGLSSLGNRSSRGDLSSLGIRSSRGGLSSLGSRCTRGDLASGDLVPLGDVFICYVNAVREYILFYEEKVREVILQRRVSSPLDVYNKIKKYAECIELLSFLCSSYTTTRDEIFCKKFFTFCKTKSSPFGKNSSIARKKLANEYNVFSNIIYGICHENCEKKHLQEEEGCRCNENKNKDQLQNGQFSNEWDVNGKNAPAKKDTCVQYHNLFIFPRGNELLSYIYRYYYIFLHSSKKNLENLCRYIFFKIIKPFLHFLYSYVYIGVNKDHYHEYVINRKVGAQFFFVYRDRVMYYDKRRLSSCPVLSLPMFLKYIIELVHSAGRILRAASQEDFYMAIPKISHFRHRRHCKCVKKRGEINKKEMNQVGTKDEIDIPKLLCAASMNRVNDILSFYNNPQYKNVGEEKETFENVFIECWNDERHLADVYRNTNANIRKKMKKSYCSFYRFLRRRMRDGACSTDDVSGVSGVSGEDDVSGEGDVSEDDVSGKESTEGDSTCARRRKNARTCMLGRMHDLRIMGKAGKTIWRKRLPKKGNHRVLPPFKGHTFAEKGYTAIEMSRHGNKRFGEQRKGDNNKKTTLFVKSLRKRKFYGVTNADCTQYSCESTNKRKFFHGGSIKNCINSENMYIIPHDENDTANEERNIHEKKMKGILNFISCTHFGKSEKNLYEKEDLLKLDVRVKSDRKLENIILFTTMRKKQKFKIKSVNYCIYRNIFVPIEKHFKNVNNILIYTFLVKKKLLLYLCQVKCALFGEQDENCNILTDLLFRKKGNNKDVVRTRYRYEQGIKKGKNILNFNFNFNEKYISVEDISRKFFHINVEIKIPSILKIYFDDEVVKNYTNVYKLVSLYYYTLQSLNGIYLILRFYAKPLAYYDKRKKNIHWVHFESIKKKDKENKREREEKNSVSTSCKAKNSNKTNFKYIDIVNTIAEKNNFWEHNDECSRDIPCVITRNINSMYITKEKYLNIGIDQSLILNDKVYKFLEKVKMFNDLIHDFNHIRREMYFIITHIYDYVINMNIFKNYFFFFQKILNSKLYYNIFNYHQTLTKNILHFSFLSSSFFSFNRTILNIINLVEHLKILTKSLVPFFLNNGTEIYSFFFLFEKNFTILHKNITILTSSNAQEIFKNFYVYRLNFLSHIRLFKDTDFGCIYNLFFFNGYYSRFLDDA